MAGLGAAPTKETIDIGVVDLDVPHDAFADDVRDYFATTYAERFGTNAASPLTFARMTAARSVIAHYSFPPF